MNGIAKHPAKDVLLPLVVVVATLYFAREFLIPLALAILISFLLAPLINRLEKIGLGRVTAVVASTLMALLLVVGIGYMVVGQFIDLAKKLPDYQSNLQTKIADFKVPKDSAISRVEETVKKVTEQVAASSAEESGNAAPAGAGKPLPVKVVNTPTNAFDTFKAVVGPIFAPLGTAALVLLLVIFFLIEREDMRDRIIHLVGRGHLQVTTNAMDEAGRRVSRYLLAQLAINVTYGVLVGAGLYFVGVPNAILWGLLSALFRFVPYVGVWIAASLPILLSLAIFPGWTRPAETFGLFLIIELICGNILEPWLYGSSTGMSPIAIIAAAAFWTWLWGGIGLLLATPLTVCIAVLGKYIPRLQFIDVLIGDKPPIACEDRFYQRLLAADDLEVAEIAEEYAKKNSVAATFDELVIPTLQLIGSDLHTGTLNDEDRQRIVHDIHEVVAELGEPDTPASPPAGATPLEEAPTVICVPARDDADEAGCVMLARVLAQGGVTSWVAPSKLLASEMLERVERSETRQFCISVIPPGSVRQATYIALRLRDRFPDARIVVGMWGSPDERQMRRLNRVRMDAVYTSLVEAAKEIAGTAKPCPETEEVSPASA